MVEVTYIPYCYKGFNSVAHLIPDLYSRLVVRQNMPQSSKHNSANTIQQTQSSNHNFFLFLFSHKLPLFLSLNGVSSLRSLPSGFQIPNSGQLLPTLQPPQPRTFKSAWRDVTTASSYIVLRHKLIVDEKHEL